MKRGHIDIGDEINNDSELSKRAKVFQQLNDQEDEELVGLTQVQDQGQSVETSTTTSRENVSVSLAAMQASAMKAPFNQQPSTMPPNFLSTIGNAKLPTIPAKLPAAVVEDDEDCEELSNYTAQRAS